MNKTPLQMFASQRADCQQLAGRYLNHSVIATFTNSLTSQMHCSASLVQPIRYSVSVISFIPHFSSLLFFLHDKMWSSKVEWPTPQYANLVNLLQNKSFEHFVCTEMFPRGIRAWEHTGHPLTTCQLGDRPESRRAPGSDSHPGWQQWPPPHPAGPWQPGLWSPGRTNMLYRLQQAIVHHAGTPVVARVRWTSSVLGTLNCTVSLQACRTSVRHIRLEVPQLCQTYIRADSFNNSMPKMA